jgi:urate oxidase
MTERLGNLSDHRYGKAGVRLLRLDRSTEPHRLFEATVEISLEGPFAEAYAEGDNCRVLPTDTMKNTVYVMARRHDVDTPEALALHLAKHFEAAQEQVHKATVQVSQKPWLRHGNHPAAFVAGGGDRDVATAVAEAGSVTVTSAIAGLVILKSSRSGFSDFPRDEYTLLQETDDRILSTSLDARWDYHDSESADFAAVRSRIRRGMLDAFADHESRSVQHTLYWMGEAALAAAPEITRIHLRMPNKHYLLVNLEPFGLDNPNVVFLPIDEPAGMIEGTVSRNA